MAAIIRHRGPGTVKGPTVFGVDLRDAREEVFVRMVCDGLSLGVAFVKAGFETSDNHDSAHKLFALPRIQERAAAILEARRTTGVVSLSEVTDMLKRVYAGAVNGEEYNAAHNAAFSLARLYGHVTDRSTVEVIRRPSRDPDAPSEQALTSWVESLPGLPAPGPASPPFGADDPSNPLPELPVPRAPAPLLENPVDQTAAATAATWPRHDAETSTISIACEMAADIQSAASAPARGQTGNGAPLRPVTGTPQRCAHPAPLGKNGSPSENEGTGYPPAEDLF